MRMLAYIENLRRHSHHSHLSGGCAEQMLVLGYDQRQLAPTTSIKPKTPYNVRRNRDFLTHSSAAKMDALTKANLLILMPIYIY